MEASSTGHEGSLRSINPCNRCTTPSSIYTLCLCICIKYVNKSLKFLLGQRSFMRLCHLVTSSGLLCVSSGLWPLPGTNAMNKTQNPTSSHANSPSQGDTFPPRSLFPPNMNHIPIYHTSFMTFTISLIALILLEIPFWKAWGLRGAGVTEKSTHSPGYCCEARYVTRAGLYLWIFLLALSGTKQICLKKTWRRSSFSSLIWFSFFPSSTVPHVVCVLQDSSWSL